MHYVYLMMDYLLHLDTYLFSFVAHYGIWIYAILFAIIFSETGLVIAPFLPGDSLLFASGSLAAQPGSLLNVYHVFILLVFASVLGNQVNYWIGKYSGLQHFFSDRSGVLKTKYLEEAHAFYEKHGGRTIILARFLPIIRTFVPFVAGIAYMTQRQFLLFNVISAVLWIGSLIFLGYSLGTLPIIKNNFTLVIYAIIIFSLLPSLLSFFYQKIKSNVKSNSISLS